MAQKLIQTQTQKQQQVQWLSQQQMLQVKLLEMPLAQLEQNVTAELDDNPALESSSPDDALSEDHGDDYASDDAATGGDEDYESTNEREERESALDDALSSIGQDDRMGDGDSTWSNNDNADYEEMVYGDTVSFYDKLKEQMGEEDLTEKQSEILEYLIGSLDNDGLLRKDLDTISDELAIYNNVDASVSEIEDVLHILQNFDPAGIGARSLQECLLLQIERKDDSRLKKLMTKVISEYFDEFTKKHWDRIKSQLAISDIQVKALQKEIRRLNPKPGASLGEAVGRNLQQITPDFIVETNDDGTISLYLNRGKVPELHVSKEFNELIDTYKNNKSGMSKKDKEALLYAKGKVDRAQGFIEAVKQRRQTLYTTMKAIIEMQRDFFLNGDEADLKPMVLKDVADKTNLDISTISRVSNVKYVQTKWGTFPLRFFFSDKYTTKEGEDVSTRAMKMTLKEILDSEDKRHPLSDDALRIEMNKRGCPIARRTVAKYREQLGIAIARLRKN
jgi:RNA polymerase sigma-54 factor